MNLNTFRVLSICVALLVVVGLVTNVFFLFGAIALAVPLIVFGIKDVK